ncbi:MAG: hypothetical protein Q7K55_04165 [Candidatus Levybacteria bacterium]|nr:hypothetical protein [Candidatus Levybacteria bacterium]
MKKILLIASILLLSYLLFAFINSLQAIIQYPLFYGYFIIAVLVLISITFFVNYHLQDNLAIYFLPQIQSLKLLILNPFFIAGIIISIASVVLHIVYDFSLPTLQADIATISYVLGIVLLGTGCYIGTKRKINNKMLFSTREKIFFALLLAIAFAIRFYKLFSIGHLPEDILWMDQAFSVIDRTIRSPFLFIGDLSTNMPVYPVAFLYLITKNVYLSTRFPSLVYDLLFLIVLFYLMFELFGKRVAFWVLVIASFSIWDIHNSRLAWHNLSTNSLLITSSLLFLVRSLKYNLYFDIFLCALSLGFAFNLLYIPAIIILAVAVFLILYFLIGYYKNDRKVIDNKLEHIAKYMLLLFFLFIMMILPTFVKLYKYPEQSLGRHKNFMEYNYKESSLHKNRFAYYLEQFSLVNNNFGFSQDHYRSDGPWGPALNYTVIFFYFLGLAYCITRLSSPGFFLLFIAWFAMFIPEVVLFLTGSVWRLINFAPLVFIFSGIGIVTALDILKKTQVKFNTKLVEKIAFISIILFLSKSTFDEFNSYYYTRTVEAQNHIFQLCQNAENQIQKFSLKTVYVQEDWCGKILKVALNEKVNIFYYHDLAGLSNVLDKKTAAISLVQENKSNNVLGVETTAQIDRSLTVQIIKDEKTTDIIKLYYVNK